jgi:hypothetical protein
LGAGTDFTRNSNGYIASFITDAGDPNLLEIPGGNWNFESYFSASSGGGSPTFYVELYKVNAGGTATLIASNSANPELISFGTTIAPYFSSLAVPTTVLALTDRLAVRYYVTHSGRTITLHTEGPHLCQIITTFTTGLTALNGLTAQVQFFAVGTSGTDFNIASATATHTFNLPTASSTNRGALSSADWALFTQAYNDKINSASVTGTTTKTLRLTQQDGGEITASWTDLNTDAVLSVFGRTGAVVAANGDYTTAQVTESGNLYYTDGRARGALSFAAGSGAYNTSTGVITIPTNNNQITNGAGYITSAALSGYLPLSGGTMTGGIVTPNGSIGIIIGDDSALADRNIANTLFLEGVQNNDRGYINFSQTSGNVLGAINGGNLTWRGNSVVTGTGASGTIPIFTGASSIGNSIITASASLMTVTSNTDGQIIQMARNGGAYAWKLGIDSSSFFNIYNNSNVSYLRINPDNGNVGIGTDTPIVKLHVTDKSLVRTGDGAWGQFAVASPNDSEVGITWGAGGTGYPGITSTYTRQWIAGLNPFGSGMDRWSLTNKTLGANTAITVLEGGNVGIGTIGPSFKLDVNGTGRFSGAVTINGDLFISSSTAAIVFNSSANFNTQIYQTGGSLVLYTGANPRLTIASTGAATFSNSVTAGSGSLFNANSGTLTQDILTVRGGGSSGNFGFRVEANNGEDIFFVNNTSYNIVMSPIVGNVLIGTTTDAGFKLEVNSGGITNGGTSKPALAIRSGGTTYLDFYQGFNSTIAGQSILGTTLVSSDDLAFASAGTERMRITLQGNVIIGGTLVQNNSANRGNLTINGTTSILNLSTSNTNAGYLFHGGTDMLLVNAKNGAQLFYTSDQPRMTIASGGSITINNLAGSGNRIVVANSGGTLISAVIGSGLAFDGTTLTATGGSSGSISGSGNSGIIPVFTGTSSIGNSVITQSSGNIGISISSPQAKSHVANLTLDNSAYQHIEYLTANNSTEASGESYSGQASYGIGFRRQWTSSTFTNMAGIYAFGSGGWRGGLLFRTKNNTNSTGEPDVNALFLSPIGNVGIGTTSVGVRLVNSGGTLSTSPTLGSATIGSNAILSENGLYGLYTGVASAGHVWQQVQRNDGGTATYPLVLQPNGSNVLIGTTTDNGNKLRVNGTIFSDSSVTATSFFESSDATLKTLVQDDYQAKGIDSVVAKLYIKNGKQELGYYAQDLEGVLPSAVSKGSNGLLNLSYREVHTAKIAYLEEEIRQIKKRYEIN